jgi:type II secretion system protein J
MSRRRPIAAFTLMELLIGVSAFAIVLAALNGVFYAALRLRNKTTESLDQTLPLEQALATIKQDLANLLPPGTLAGQLQTTPTTGLSAMGLLPGAQATSPAFYTATGVIDETSPWAEEQRVTYFLAEPTNQTRGLDLVRAVTRNLLAPIEEPPLYQRLAAGIDSLSFLFYDGADWIDSWDSTTADPKLPLAIKVQIGLTPQPTDRLRPLPIELVVPLEVQAGTNQTAQAQGAAR